MKLAITLFVGLLFFGLVQAQPREQRVALVIGNGAYKASPLKNPVNDARDMATKLRSLGFVVVERNNLGVKQIGSTLREFRSKLTPGSVALIFYAGHGLQIKGENYLPAVDAEIMGEEDVPNQSLAIRQIMDVLVDAKTRLNLVFLDACRDNPYARSFRSASRGLSKENAPSGTLISFATRPGGVAADGDGRNGIYTSALLQQIDNVGLPIEQVLKRVVTSVKTSTKNQQEPWMEGSIEGEFCFGDCSAVTATPAAAPALSAAQLEERFWEDTKSVGNKEAFEAYIASYPQGRYVALARANINRLANVPTTTTTPYAPQPLVTKPTPELTKPVEEPLTLTAEERQAETPQFIWPARGKLLNGFNESASKGLDISGKAGDPIVAAASGRVVYAGSGLRGYGKVIIISHNKNFTTAYAHNRELLVKENQQVERGQKIAELGDTDANQPKLHFEIRRNGKPVDPAKFLPLPESAESTLSRDRLPLPAGKVFKDCDDCPEMVVIPAGTFLMGSNGNNNERPQHRVSIRSFAVGKFEVTKEQWFAVMGTLPSNFKDRALPVGQVSWTDAKEFVQKLSAKTGSTYRLPSEAEWEYAARAGNSKKYFFGEDVGQLDRYAWFAANSSNTTHIVGGKLPNPFGLYDIYGNVWEWTEDCWNESYLGAPADGSAWLNGICDRRVWRGGGIDAGLNLLISSYRYGLPRNYRHPNLGFRIVRDLP